MAPLPADLRRNLGRIVLRAREVAERGARGALQVLAVDAERPFDTLSTDQRAQRNALRARMRALAPTDAGQTGATGAPPRGFAPLVEEVAYEHWHQMLFARFLEQNHLLIHPRHGVAISLEECADIAESEGEPDEWMVAAKFASAMMPGIFGRDDPALRIRYASNDRADLERILKELPLELFLAEDALGWLYQFWQTTAKEAVNSSGRKVGGHDLAPVTQLFTDHYMVRFLLENSLGAWWAARHPDSPLLSEWKYLRFVDNGVPAAGEFSTWPDKVADITVMDPCCGSGHFLVAAADMLRGMRMEQEGISAEEAAEAVIRENVFGLELDPRCTQLATFALILDAWKAGYDPRGSTTPNIACSGIAVAGPQADWRAVAGEDTRLEQALTALHAQFRNAPSLGSLIDPRRATDRSDLFYVDYSQVGPVLEDLLSRESDPEAQVVGRAVAGLNRAAVLLSRTYTLIATNVPYLTRGKQDQVLRDYSDIVFHIGRADLATTFVMRCRGLVQNGGSLAIVSPQYWLTLKSYAELRKTLISEMSWRLLTLLGPGAFESISGAVVQPMLTILEESKPTQQSHMLCQDLSGETTIAARVDALRDGEYVSLSQMDQLANPDGRILLTRAVAGPLLSDCAASYTGTQSGDDSRFKRCYWELAELGPGWRPMQSAAEFTTPYGGREHVVRWDGPHGVLQAAKGAYVRGKAAWNNKGVVISRVSTLAATLFTGEVFDDSAVVVVPRDESDLRAIWSYCSSHEYKEALRRLEKKTEVAPATMVKVPFDRDRWKAEAAELYAEGLPAARSADPTQWLFDGEIVGSDSPLQVAVGTLVGSRWPGQAVSAIHGHSADDGIVCVPALPGQRAAADRLRALLTAAYSEKWSPATLDDLLTSVGYAGVSLERWLRDGFFEQHCKLFHQRPFVWQVWDNRHDGFSALVNYRSLDRPKLEKLAYTYLGSWLERQRDEKSAGLPGADDRLAAAQALQRKLALILEGEPPHDIFVRWKEAHEQPLGWAPDPDDGVRMNIRPFTTAGVLRWKPNIKWGKDRGKNPDGGDRVNDRNLTIAAKRDARLRAGVSA